MALILQNDPAPNGPGASPTWSRGDKDGVGTAYSASSQVWYTVAGGIITEVYYPDVDTPQIRDMQLLVTDGKTFFHDGTRDFDNTCELANRSRSARPAFDQKGERAALHVDSRRDLRAGFVYPAGPNSNRMRRRLL
jgi:hypothetical protein